MSPFCAEQAAPHFGGTMPHPGMLWQSVLQKYVPSGPQTQDWVQPAPRSRLHACSAHFTPGSHAGVGQEVAQASVSPLHSQTFLQPSGNVAAHDVGATHFAPSEQTLEHSFEHE